MKKILAIILLLAFMSSTTELHEVFKLPVLISHFLEHQKQDNNLSFVAFIEMHYAEKVTKDADYDTDMKLPFKSHDGCSFAQVSATTLTSPQEFKKIILSSPNEVIINSNLSIPLAYLSSIWQPPKMA